MLAALKARCVRSRCLIRDKPTRSQLSTPNRGEPQHMVLWLSSQSVCCYDPRLMSKLFPSLSKAWVIHLIEHKGRTLTNSPRVKRYHTWRRTIPLKNRSGTRAYRACIKPEADQILEILSRRRCQGRIGHDHPQWVSLGEGFQGAGGRYCQSVISCALWLSESGWVSS